MCKLILGEEFALDHYITEKILYSLEGYTLILREKLALDHCITERYLYSLNFIFFPFISVPRIVYTEIKDR